MSTLLQLGPLLGGSLLLIICFANIVRNPQISNANAALLAFGALLFAVPTFTNFSFFGPGFEITAQSVGKQLVVQGADTKLGLADIKQAVIAIANKLNASVPTAAAPGPLVLVVYVQDQLNLALQIQNFLLQKGYPANAVHSDFSEVTEAARGQPGTARLIYVSRLQDQAHNLLSELQAKFPSTSWSTAANDNLSAANIEIKVF